MLRILIALTVGILLLSLPSDAAPSNEQESTKYCNARYGFCVSYPQHFGITPSPENGDGRRFYDKDGLVVVASGINNALDETMQAQMRSQSEDFDKVTYRAEGKNWFVLSGHKGTNILYRKTFVGEGSVNHLNIEYPASLKTKYDVIVSKVARSFKAGNLDVSH